MDETQKLYDVLKREGYYTKSFDEFQSQFQDSEYQDKVFGVVSRDGLYTKDKESFLSKYVKKKVGAESSESLAEPTTSGDFEQWEIDMFKGFDENPSLLSTASNIDLEKYGKYKKSRGEDRPLVSTPEQEFLISGEVDTPQAPILSQAEKDAQAEKESMLKGLSDDEKTIVGSAIDETNNWYAERGGMTPFVKMQELNRRVNELQSDISAEDISRMTTDEIDALDTKYKQSVLDIANELGLSVKEDGTISPYESEVNEFKDRLDFYTRVEDDKRKEEGKASFGQDIMNKLASGYEQASANVLDMVGAVTGLNYFDSYKNLSEGGRYNAEKLRSYANRYDGTIEDYLVNGEIGKAAGLAVGGAMESLPSMLPVFVNPQYGLYVMSGMSGIDKYREIEDKDIPEWSKYYNAFITGASEYAGEKIVTIPILKRSKQAIKSLGEKGGKQAIENALKKSVENNAAKFGRMPEWVAEGMSEVATGISTDIVDKVTIDPNTKIGSHAVDDFVVGALMGKVFALPQDLARGMNTLAARDFSRNVLDKLPSDMNTEDKISLGWKMVERNKLQEAEDKLDDAFKGKYQARIVELNGEIADMSAKYNDMQQPTVGTTEEVGNMQDQLDYLNEKGVDANGLNAEQVQKLYDKTKSEEDKQAIDGKRRVKLPPEMIEKEAAFDEKDKKQEIFPSESIVRVKHGTTSLTADKIENSGFAFEGLTGEERLSSATQGEGIYTTRANALSPTFDMGADALMPEYSDYLEFDISTEKALFPTKENEDKYGEQVTWNEGDTLQRIKDDGYNVLILNTPDEGGRQVIILDKSAIVSNIDRVNRFDKIEEVEGKETAINKANETIANYEDAAANVIIEKNRQQYEAVVNSAKDYLARVEEPRVTNLKEETKDDEKEVQEQQVQEQDEERQTEKPAEEVEVSEAGAAQSQEDVVQEAVEVKPFKKGDGGTKGTFVSEDGTVYKSVVPTEGRIVDGRAERIPIEGIETDEYEILSEIQDRDYVPRIGEKVDTSEGKAFEIEKLDETDKISREEYIELRRQLQELEDGGYYIGDNVSVMRRNGKLVIVDFSNAHKDNRGSSNLDYIQSVHDLLSPMDRAWVESQLEAQRLSQMAELLDDGTFVENEYLLTQRPPSIGTHPTDNLVGEPVETKMGGRTIWKLRYSKPLSIDDIKRFELSPVLSLPEYVGKMIDGVAGTIPFYVRDIKDRTVTLEAINPKGKTVTQKIRSADFVEKIANGDYIISEPSIDKAVEPPKTTTEAKTEQKGTITPTEEESALKRPQRSEADFNEFVKDVVSDETNLTGLDLGLSGKQKTQAIRNIKEGKETVASKTLTDALRQMYDSGDVTFTGGIERGGARRTVPFEEFRQSLQRSAEREREIEKEATDVVTGEQAKAVEQATKQPSEQKIKEASKQIADTLRKAKFTQSLDDLSKLKSDPTAPLQLAWDGAIELAAKTIEAGGTVAQAVADGVSYLKESDWYKSLSDNSKKIAEQRVSEDITKTLEDAKKQQGSKVQKESPKKRKEQGQRDKDMPKGDRSKLQDGKKKEKEVRRGIDITMDKYGGVYADIVKENPLFYTQRSSEGGIIDAVDWLESHTDKEIYKALSRSGKVHPDWQDRRQLYLAQLGKQLDQLVKDGKTDDAEEVLKQYENVREALAKDYTTAGQTGQRGAVWKKLSNDVISWNISNSIDKYNKSRVPESDYDKLKESGEEINEASKEFGKGLVDEQSVIDAINKVVGKYDKGKVTNKEKAKKIANKVRSIKSSNWGLTLAADPISSVGIGILDGALEVTARTIETTGNIADAIQKGIKFIKASEWYSSLNEDAKRKVERKYSYNTRSELGVEKLTKKELDSYLKRETKDLKKALTDLINEHWSTKNTLGIKLSERIVSDLGLSEADAKIVADAIQEIINEKIANNLTDFVGPDTVPKSKGAKKNFIHKMGDMMMRGDLDTDLFKDSFAESFGLKKDLTAEETNYILNLYKAVVATEDMGAYGDIVADLFAKEIDRLMPQTMVSKLLKTMVGLDYSNVLMGPATWKVNILSALTNAISSPITKTLDPVQWANAVKGSKSLSDFATLNPIIEGLFQYGWFSTGVVNRGTTDLINILKNGDLRAMHKYISELQSTAKLRVPELERTLSGKYRFKPFKITLSNGKKVNINPTELSKYSGRMLAAQDALLNKGFETAIMAQQLTRKLTKEGVSKKEIYQQVLRQVYGYGLTEKEKDAVDKKVDKEEETLKKYGIKYDKLQRNKRRLEVMQEMYLTLDEEELTDIKKTAKNQVFNDNRGGVVNEIMGRMSKFANKNIITKLGMSPHFMFFKIFGNIGDHVIDTVPIYGTVRYMGWSPTTLIATGVKSYQDGATLSTAIKDAVFGKRYKVTELPFLTAQMGDKGSIAREKQRERAMTGNAMLLPAIAIISGLWAFGDDDEGEPWFDVSGARLDLKNYDERNNPSDKMPPYTIKLGDWKFKYNTKPALMFAAGWLGAYRDMQRAGMEGETVTARMRMMGWAYLRALTTVSDLQIAGGFKDLNESMSRLFTTAQAIKSDPNAEELSTRKMISNFGKFMVKKQASMFTMWLPTRNNFLQQSWQYLDPNKVESKDIDAMMMYNLGIHKWTNLPAIDIFGFQMQSKPGYTNIYYDPLMEKTRPEEWERYVKLSEEKAMPQAPMNNRQMVINPVGAEEEYEYINPDDKEFWDFRHMAGQKFYEDISEYQDSEAWEVEKNRKKSSITGEKTVLQDNVSKYWSNAKTQTRDYLFTWREFRKENPDLFDALYEADAVPSRISSVKIADMRDNAIYRDKDGNIVVADEINLGQQELFGFNARVMDKFINSMRLVPTNSPLYKDMAKSNWDMARELVELEITIEQ